MFDQNVLFFCFITFLTSVVVGDDVLDWTKANDVVYDGPKFVEEGQTFRILCRMSHFNAPKWTLNDVPIDDSKRISYENKIGVEMSRIETLIVTNATAADSGFYRCNSFSRAYHRLHVITSQPSTEPSVDHKVIFEEIKEEFSTVTLPCNINVQSDDSQILWFRNGNQIQNDERRSIDKSLLVIKNATSAVDAGDYMCQVDSFSVRGGSQFGQMIQLRAPIRVKPFPKSKTAVIGQRSQLECQYTGYPFGQIKWIVGNRALDTKQMSELGIELTVNKDSHPNAVLVIKKVNESHKNSYTCVVSNGYSTDESSLILNVRENAIVTNSPVLLLEGKTIQLTCNKTEGDRVLDSAWQWKKEGTVYSDLEGKDRYSLKGNSLIIEKAHISDAGDWTCNTEGNSAEIVVLTRPFLMPFEEFQKTNYKSANIIEGERFHLNCRVMEGYGLKTKLNWFKFNESEFDNPNKVLVPISDEGPDGHLHLNTSNPIEQTLTIDKVVPSDRFYYVCLASNNHFQFNNTILLRVKDKLGALWPFLGIVAEVVILCTIIFIYEKRRIKPDFDDSDNENNTEPKSTQDSTSKSQDVRQRK